MAKFFYFSAAFSLLTILGCLGNAEGERLFEVQYPVHDFVIPAGQQSNSTIVAPQASLPTRFAEEIARANVTADDIDLIGGFRARVVSLTGDNFNEIRRIELRACPLGQRTGCDPAQLIFTVDDLVNRNLRTVNLNPSLVNARETFLGEQMRVEVVLFPVNVTTISFDARLEWSVQAVGDLD
ncbi:hypothetical protein [Neolewinella antarctica]|uniref:Lipoprotein n=1 Tax=Neolewinella antarctica TaxID=442734 RepID=A0ABX0XEQ0_9BACT|nr:hypothetical protein [Neolewinella antarctica]NJC27379.1 hypothetical protein [Neolewinella antarctica]